MQDIQANTPVEQDEPQTGGTGQGLPLVTIGMPVHNGAKTVPGALKSLLAQTYPNFRIVVCDNASTDETAKVVQELAKEHPQITLRHFPELVGIQDSYRRALETREEGYFLFAPSDDRWGETFVQQAVTLLESNPQAAVCCGQIEMFDDDGRTWRSGGVKPVRGRSPKRWRRALLSTSDASRLYGLLRSSACSDIIPGTSPEGWDHYTCAKLALRGTIEYIDVPAMVRHQTPTEKYRAQVFAQEPTFWGRVFFMRHVLALFRADPEFRTRSIPAQATLYSFLFSQTRLALNEDRWRFMRFCFKKMAGVLGLIGKV